MRTGPKRVVGTLFSRLPEPFPASDHRRGSSDGLTGSWDLRHTMRARAIQGISLERL